MTDDEAFDRRIKATLADWAGTVDVEPDLAALERRETTRPWNTLGARVLGVAAVVLLMAAIATSLRGPAEDADVSTDGPDRSRTSSTTVPADDRGPDPTVTTTTGPVTTTTNPGDLATAPPQGPGDTGTDAGPGPGSPTPSPVDPDGPGDDIEGGDREPDCLGSGGVVMTGGWLARVNWTGYLQDTPGALVVVDLGRSGSTRRVALYRSGGAPDCYLRVNDTNGRPLEIETSTLATTATDIHVFGCRNPQIQIADGATTDGVTWTFHHRAYHLVGNQAELVEDYSARYTEPADRNQLDFFRRFDCDDSTS